MTDVVDTGVGGLESAARPDPAPPGSRPARFPCFDGFRFVAAFLVLVTHTSFISGQNFRDPFGAYLARMDIGVAVFFLISGFLLYRPFVAAHLAGTAPPAPAAYFRRRALRIFPAYWLALSAVLLVSDKSLQGLDEYALHYGLVQIYSHEHLLEGLTQAWSLATEITFYVFLPLWAWLVRRVAARAGGALRAELTGVVVLYAVSVVFRTWVIGSGRDIGLQGTWLPATLDLFALGMVLAVVSTYTSAHPGGGDRLARLAQAFGAVPGLWWATAAALFWIVSTGIGLPRDLSPVSYAQSMGRQLLYGSAAFFFLLPGIFGRQDRGAIRRVLRVRAIEWLGLVSYGIYLWHELWIEEWFQWTGRHPFTGHFVELTLATTVLTVVAAAVSYHLVERPALARKDRAASPPRQNSPHARAS